MKTAGCSVKNNFSWHNRTLNSGIFCSLIHSINMRLCPHSAVRSLCTFSGCYCSSFIYDKEHLKLMQLIVVPNNTCIQSEEQLWIFSFSLFSGYLGYSSGFSLSCMVFFLTAVSWSNTHSGTSSQSLRTQSLFCSGMPSWRTLYVANFPILVSIFGGMCQCLIRLI